MKVSVCVLRLCLGAFPLCLLQTGFTFPVGGHPILRQQRSQRQGTAKLHQPVASNSLKGTVLHSVRALEPCPSLCQCLEKGGCPWTERWDLALLLLCQSYAEPNRRASEKKLLNLYKDS